MLDVRLQEAQRDGALLQDGVVEGAHVKLSGQAALGFGAQLSDFELAKLVGQRLARPGPGLQARPAQNPRAACRSRTPSPRQV